MADADGATKFKDIEKVEKGLENLQPWPVRFYLATFSPFCWISKTINMFLFLSLKTPSRQN